MLKLTPEVQLEPVQGTVLITATVSLRVVCLSLFACGGSTPDVVSLHPIYTSCVAVGGVVSRIGGLLHDDLMRKVREGFRGRG